MVLTQELDAKLNPCTYVYTDNFSEAVSRKVRYENPKRFVWESKDAKSA